MTGALWIPGADRTSAFYGNKYPNAAMSSIEKLLLHSTETTGLPGYNGGATAPTVTIDPWNRKVWQHFAINRPARALGNPSSTPVSENKDRVFQAEIIGYSDPDLGKPRGRYLPNLSDAGLQFIADVLIFVRKEWPGSTKLPPTWPLYKVSSYAAMQDAHLSSAEYDSHNGLIAHLHAPKPSTHGDVALNIRALKAKVDAGLSATTTAPQEDEVTPQDIKAVVDGVLGAKVVPSLMLSNEEAVTIPRALDLVMRWALEGRDNAIVARKVAEAQAQLGRPMSADEVSSAVKQALSEAARIEVVVKPEVTP